MTVTIKNAGKRSHPDGEGALQSTIMANGAGALSGVITAIEESFRLYRVTGQFDALQTTDIVIMLRSRHGTDHDYAIKTVPFATLNGVDFIYEPDGVAVYFIGDEIEITGVGDGAGAFIVDYGQIEQDFD